MKNILLVLFFMVYGCLGTFAQQFNYNKIAPHPRLLLPEGGERQIKAAIAAYAPLDNVHKKIMAFADQTLDEKPVERIKKGKRLLDGFPSCF